MALELNGSTDALRQWESVRIPPAKCATDEAPGYWRRKMLRLGLSGEKIARFAARALAVSMLVAAANEGSAQPATAGIPTPAVAYAPQGWSDTDRDTFYTTSQRSHMMPYAW